MPKPPTGQDPKSFAVERWMKEWFLVYRWSGGSLAWLSSEHTKRRLDGRMVGVTEGRYEERRSKCMEWKTEGSMNE
jgi:hypothetical protein